MKYSDDCKVYRIRYYNVCSIYLRKQRWMSIRLIY